VKPARADDVEPAFPCDEFGVLVDEADLPSLLAALAYVTGDLDLRRTVCGSIRPEPSNRAGAGTQAKSSRPALWPWPASDASWALVAQVLGLGRTPPRVRRWLHV